jgi:MFS family permease
MRWTATDTWAFWSFALGMLLENYTFSLAAIATNWVTVPKSLDSLLLAWAPLWLIIGIALAGPLADRFGRKSTFYLTMTLYTVGAIGLVFSYSYGLLLFFLAVMLLAAGGEMNTIMAASQEMMPEAHRGKTMMMELNFINLGGFLLALLALSSAYQQVHFQRLLVGVTAIIALFILFYIRLRTPESLRWLLRRGREEEARAQAERYYGAEAEARLAQARTTSSSDPGGHTPMWIRFFTTLTISFAGAAGFGLLTYVIGPYYFKNLTATILLIATGVGFFSGFFGLAADRLSRKGLLLIGYLGSTLVTLWILVALPEWSKSLPYFFALLILLNLFVNIGYLTEDTLKAEVWPTERRGTYTALVRFISIGLYIVTIYLTQNLSIQQYILFSLVVWAIGLAGALVWWFFGHETGRGVDLARASGE